MEEMQSLFVEQRHVFLSASAASGSGPQYWEEFLLLKRVLLASRELQGFYTNSKNVRLEQL